MEHKSKEIAIVSRVYGRRKDFFQGVDKSFSLGGPTVVKFNFTYSKLSETLIGKCQI